MTTSPPPVKKKENTFVKAVGDLVILGLLLAGAGFGGYFWGTHQQLAPVLKVGPGTPGTTLPPKAADAATATETVKKRKFWLASSGTEYIGYSITAKVNDTTVDNFYAGGKIVDVTPYVQPGTNTVEFEAKQLGSEYNKHVGDSNSKLTLNLVSGTSMSDNYKQSDVLAKFERNAAETDNQTDTVKFVGE